MFFLYFLFVFKKLRKRAAAEEDADLESDVESSVDRDVESDNDDDDMKVMQDSESDKLEVNDYVIVNYLDTLYPGRIIEVGKSGAKVSTMEPSKSNWKWPEKADVLFYSRRDITGKISVPEIMSNRGLYKVAELDKKKKA